MTKRSDQPMELSEFDRDVLLSWYGSIVSPDEVERQMGVEPGHLRKLWTTRAGKAVIQWAEHIMLARRIESDVNVELAKIRRREPFLGDYWIVPAGNRPPAKKDRDDGSDE